MAEARATEARATEARAVIDGYKKLDKEPREVPKPCPSTIVLPQQIEINGVSHHATVAHRCTLLDGHFPATNCECACGHKWVRNYK